LANFGKVSKPFIYAPNGKNVISAIARKFGGELFFVQGRNNSIQATATKEQGSFKVNQSHGINFQVFGDSPEKSQFLDDLAHSKLIAIYKDANGWYRVCGGNGGLLVTADGLETGNEDNGGGHSVEMVASKEKTNPLFLCIGYNEVTGTYDESATDLYVESLLQPVTMNITGITAGVSPIITVASTVELTSGMNVTFKNIVWTTPPTAPNNLLNDSTFTIEVINATTFKIVAGVGVIVPTFNTTGGVYGSGGTIQQGKY
jgi:hypothetical protein